MFSVLSQVTLYVTHGYAIYKLLMLLEINIRVNENIDMYIIDQKMKNDKS